MNAVLSEEHISQSLAEFGEIEREVLSKQIMQTLSVVSIAHEEIRKTEKLLTQLCPPQCRARLGRDDILAFSVARLKDDFELVHRALHNVAHGGR